MPCHHTLLIQPHMLLSLVAAAAGTAIPAAVVQAGIVLMLRVRTLVAGLGLNPLWLFPLVLMRSRLVPAALVMSVL